MFCLCVEHVINNLFGKILFQVKWKWLNACESVFLDYDDLSCGHPVESVCVCVCGCACMHLHMWASIDTRIVKYCTFCSGS